MGRAEFFSHANLFYMSGMVAINTHLSTHPSRYVWTANKFIFTTISLGEFFLEDTCFAD